MTDRLISFDPAAHHAAWAAFEDGRLKRCGLEAAKPLEPALDFRFRGIMARVVIEQPQVYGKRGDADPNDLIAVAITAGRIAQAFAFVDREAEFVRPHAWKGSVPKAVMLARIEKRLDADEIIALNEAKAKRGLRHNIVDAIGVGLWALGRLGK